MDENSLDNVLLSCTKGEKNAPQSEQERLLEDLWKKQSQRLDAHQKYLAESVEIQPVPRFIAKVMLHEEDQTADDAQKVFLNICSHHLVPNLSVAAIPVDDGEQTEQGIRSGIRFPMSCGPRIPIKDKKGNAASTYDVVLHPDVIAMAEQNKQYRVNVAMAAVQNIMQKSGQSPGVVFTGHFTFPKGVYRGVDAEQQTPHKQRIRKKGAAKFVQEEVEDNEDTKEESPPIATLPPKEDRGEAANTEKAPPPKKKAKTEVVLEPEYYVFCDEKWKRKRKAMKSIDEVKKYLSDATAKEMTGIQICLDLKGEVKLSELDLETSLAGLLLSTTCSKKRELICVEWNEFGVGRGMAKAMDLKMVCAKFSKKTGRLKISVPFKSK